MDPVDGITVVDKEKLLKESDIIVVCLPLNSSTKDYISTKEISLMKDGVIIVNPAREEIVNKDAVLDGIETSKIYGYGIETPIMKQIPSNDHYYNYPNIIVTPHNAFNTIDADKRTYETVRDNVINYLKGNPQNLVF
ncbi:MAG: NAD(P)-dependent oxidoreductase, partial [Candidatus Dojkabacteria bacterium]|nr:NAD(P)-dependent oxidoreductase [Candidatus Dojkabacteria bacterium]